MADDFLATYAPLANDIATRTGVDPSVVLGIIDTETGHGQHVSGNNIFGISPSGPQGQYVAGYPDVQTASNAFVGLMQTPRYAGVAAAPDPASQAAMLVRSGYNTANPNYASIVANKALNFGKQLGYQDGSGPQSGTSINVASSQPAPDYNGTATASAQPPAAPAPDYNTPAPAAAPAQPPAQGSAKDRVLADPALAAPGGGGFAAPAQPLPQTAKDRLLADPALQAPPDKPADEKYPSSTPGEADAPPWMMQAPPSLEDIRGAIQKGDINALNYEKAHLGTGILGTAAMLGTHLLAGAAQIPLNIAIGATQGPGGLTWNPETGTYGATPELQAATSLGPSGLRFSGPNPLQFLPPGTAERAPIPADVAPSLLSPDVAARLRGGEGSAQAAPGPPMPTVTVTAPRPTGVPATDTTGLTGFGSGAAQAIGGNLRDMLWTKLQQGDTTELGQPSRILIAAKAAMDQGVIKTRADFDAWTQQWGRPQQQGASPAGGGWRPVQPGEVFPPGQSFRMNQTTGQSEVFDPQPGVAPAPATPVQPQAAAPSSPTGVPVTPPPAVTPGAAQPVGAQVTPGYEAIYTPAEEAAYRARAEGQKLLEPQKIGEPDLNQYIPGETANSAEREQTVKAARELKELGIRVPEASDMDKAAADSNNTARTIYLDNTTKGPVEINNEKVARQTDIASDKAKVFAPDNVTGPVDLQPVIKQMEDVLNQPFNRQNTALQQAYRPWLDRMKAFPNATIDNPEEAWGLRYDIDQQTDKFAQRDNPNMHRVAHNLADAADTIDTQIDKVAPGYADMLARYKEHSRAIDEMEVLQGAKDKFRGPGQKLTYNDFQRYMKNVVDSRMTPSTDLNQFKAISDANIQRLWNIRDSLRRTASAQELAKAAGSDTMPNIIDALRGIGRMGGTAALHAYVGAHLGPGGNLALQSLGSIGRHLVAQRTIRRATTQMNRLLNPSQPLRVPPGQENPLQP